MTYNNLFHGFGLLEFNYIKTEYKSEGLFFLIEAKKPKLKCNKCKSKNVTSKGAGFKLFRMISNRFRPSFIKAMVKDWECNSCGSIGQEEFHIPKSERIVPYL